MLSTALRLASPIFNKMLDSSSLFLEGHQLALSSKDFPAIVILKEDDPEALEIILNIAYHRRHLVPKWLEPEKMFAVAVLYDKYNIMAALRN